jgi:CheY-like chemotaxis protein
MTKKLKTVLLIDDDEGTNFIHEFVIKNSNCAEEVCSVQSGSEALNYLKAMGEKNLPQPDLIFLDINMPGMNGWEFLKKYDELNQIKKESIVVVMLTTSLNPDDEKMAKSIPSISGFKNKPLTTETIEEVIEDFFQNK